MAQKRRSRAWWSKTVERYKGSGLSARQFAEREGLAAGTLGWWSSQLRRGTRAQRGAEGAVPLEVQLPRPAATVLGTAITIEAHGAVVRLAAGTDPEYVAAIVHYLGRQL